VKHQQDKQEERNESAGNAGNTATILALPEEVDSIGRRQLLRTGVSLVAYMAASKLFAPRTARAQVAQASTDFSVQRKLVWINMSGGWDILETVDPKQRSSSKLDVAYDWALAHRLAGSTTDVRVGRHLPGLASIGADVVLVRGLAMGTTSHDAGSVYMDTGILSNTGRVNAASVPSIVASESDATIPIIQLGGGSEPLIDRGLLNPVSLVRAQNLDLYRSMYPTDKKDTARRLALLDYMKKSIARAERTLGKNDRLTAVGSAESKIRGQINSDLGAKLSVTDADKALFAPAAGAGMGMGGGAGDAFALALKLIKNDLATCVNMGLGGFDTHAGQDRQLAALLPPFDAALKIFVNELRKAGKLDTTLIVLYSDFGRTPKINGSAGRDHWPVGGAVMIGGGIAGGRAVGGTDGDLLALNCDLDTGTTPGSEQLSPVHLAGAVVKLCIGEEYMPYRSYLEAPGALTKLKD